MKRKIKQIRCKKVGRRVGKEIAYQDQCFYCMNNKNGTCLLCFSAYPFSDQCRRFILNPDVILSTDIKKKERRA